MVSRKIAVFKYGNPTNASTALGLQHPSYDVLEQHKVSRSSDFEALKLGKGPVRK